MKAVVDSSVLLSAFLRSFGATRDIFHHAKRGRFELCLSETILKETAESLLRKVDRFNYTPDEVIEYITLLSTVATVVRALPDLPPVCRDPDDDHVIAAGVAAGAAVIVTGDDDLLTLHEYEGIRIVSVRAFLDILSG